jgi:hypothetical protein
MGVSCLTQEAPMRLYRAHAFPLAAIVLSLCQTCQTVSAQPQPVQPPPLAPGIADVQARIATNTKLMDGLSEAVQDHISKFGEILYTVYGQQGDPAKKLLDLKQAYDAVHSAVVNGVTGQVGPAVGQLGQALLDFGSDPTFKWLGPYARSVKNINALQQVLLEGAQLKQTLTELNDYKAQVTRDTNILRDLQKKSSEIAARSKGGSTVTTKQPLIVNGPLPATRPSRPVTATPTGTDPSALTPVEQAARDANQKIVANETLNKAPNTLNISPDGTTTYNPGALTPAEQTARNANQQIVANETLNKTPSTLKTAPDGSTTYNPGALTPAEQAARNANQQIVASETLGTGKIPSAQPNAPELIDLLNCSEAGTKNYYTTTTGQNCGDFLKGQASRTNKMPSTLKTSSNGVTTYDPSALTPAEQAARNANQQIVAGETLNKTPSTLKTSSNGVTTYDPSALTPAEQTARNTNQQIVAGETLNKTPSTLKTSPAGSTTYDPSALTPVEQAARNANQQIVAGETLNKTPSTLKTSPNGVTTYDPSTLSSSEQAARQQNEAIVAGETVPSVASNFGYPSNSRQSPDGRLTATMQWSFKNAGGPWPQATGSWAVYDQGRYVGTYNSDVVLSNNGKFQVLVTPGASALLTTDGKPLAPVYTTVDAGLQVQTQIQKQQFSQQNKETLSLAGYTATAAYGGGIFAGAKGSSWDLLDSSGNKINDGGYAQTKSLGGGAVAATKNPTGTNWDVFGPNGNQLGSGYQQVKAIGNGAFAVSNDPLGYVPARWTVLDLSGHQIGNGPYTYVAASGNRIAVEKLGDNGFSYLNAPAITQQTQPAAAVAPKTTVAPAQQTAAAVASKATVAPAQQTAAAVASKPQAAINSQLSKSGSMKQAAPPSILKTSSLKLDQPVKEQALNAAHGVVPALKSGSPSTALASKTAEVATVKPTPALPVSAHEPSPVYAPPPMPRMERLQVYAPPPVYVPPLMPRMERLQVYAPPPVYVPPSMPRVEPVQVFVPPPTLRVEPVQTIYVSPLQRIEPQATVKSSVPSPTYSAPAYSATPVHTAPPPPPVHHK